MNISRWIYASVGGACVLLLLGLWLAPKLQTRLAPQPVAAWVGIEVEGSGVAEVGKVRITSGTPFRLHAVLEARAAGGEQVFYTEAARLRLGGRPVPDEALRTWDQPRRTKLLWFTVEGVAPYLALEPGEGLGRFRFQEFLRDEWGSNWSIAGELESRFNRQLEASAAARGRTFGTQRFQVWIEIYDDEKAFIPSHRFKSPGAEQLVSAAEGRNPSAAEGRNPSAAAGGNLSEADAFPTVVASSPGAAGPASRAFGLTQIDPHPGTDAAVLAELSNLAQHELAFSRLTVLRDLIRGSNRKLEDLRWRRLQLGGREVWGDVVGPGDLLRVGARVVVVWQDAGEPGILDLDDLCFDFEKGATVRRVGEVFSGEGDVEWARLRAGE